MANLDPMRWHGTQDDPRAVTKYVLPGEQHWAGIGFVDGRCRYRLIRWDTYCLLELARLGAKGDACEILEGVGECAGMVAIGRVE